MRLLFLHGADAVSYTHLDVYKRQIEGITSPDGRVFGKMAHAERRDNGVAVNIYGEQDLKIFESGVAYFK